MIVKRQKPKPVRRIVRRNSQPTVGARAPRAIVKRSQGVVRETGGGGGFTFPALSRLLFAGALCVAVAVLAGTTWWAWQSPLFRVSSVEVEGNRAVTAEAIAAAIQLDNDSLFTVDLASAERALTELPLVAGADVKRAWPNGVSVTIDEREAWGTWVQGGVAYAIDRDGVVLGTTPVPEGSPVIRTADTLTLRPGDIVDYQAVDAAAELYEQLPAALGTGINEIAYLPGKGVQVETTSGMVGLLGDSGGIAYKLAVWAAVADQAAAEGINYSSIDLRYGNRPVLN